jgi:MtN3 and saliva related transmembrane protein
MSTIIDDNLPNWVNALIIIANIINFIYNIPQIYRTFKRKSTRDISGIFLLLRLIGNTLMLIYTIYISDIQLCIANSVTVLSSIFLCFYKIHDILEDRSIRIHLAKNNESCHTITSLHILILELQEMVSNINSETILVENMVIGKKKYKILYLGNNDLIPLNAIDNDFQNSSSEDNQYLSHTDNYIVDISLTDERDIPLDLNNETKRLVSTNDHMQSVKL